MEIKSKCVNGLVKKLVAKRHFEKFKVLFGIEKKEEMQLLIDKCKGAEKGYRYTFGNIQGIESFIKSEELCINP